MFWYLFICRMYALTTVTSLIKSLVTRSRLTDLFYSAGPHQIANIQPKLKQLKGGRALGTMKVNRPGW